MNLIKGNKMNLPLTFRQLAVPLSGKALRAFRKDAGWADVDAATGEPPQGKVQWVTVESGKKTIGIARLELAPPEFCYVADLIILRTHHGQGVGQWFVKHIERYCAQFGIPRLLLRPLEGTQGFYEKQHFVPDPYVAPYLKKEINPFQRKMLVH
jgi:GNAT superfamily N-acetyltransferase